MMTQEMVAVVEAMMDEVVGGRWFEEGLTEEQCSQVCAQCPYAGQCGEGLCYSCPCWEEAMGADV